ncbi:MAG: TIM barrel protein [Gracilibacteraceae bacterium]|jgi:hydroxypyruvate isomerase|nr:TIM barrel protein [Gracilibacteraceae bacterium]
MPRFSANLGFLFTEAPFLDRFQAAAAAGFRYVEFKSPYDYDLREIRQRLDACGLEAVLINMPDGDWDAGDRGLAADPARRDEFRLGVSRALEAAAALNVQRVNCLTGNAPAGAEKARIEDNLAENLSYAAGEMAKDKRLLMVEPLNGKDNPAFYLNDATKAADFLRRLGCGNVYLQYDVYHEAQMERDLLGELRACAPLLGHVQIADWPGRHEPGTGSVDFRAWFAALAELGYDGFVGMEYIPAAGTTASLRWLTDFGFDLRSPAGAAPLTP